MSPREVVSFLFGVNVALLIVLALIIRTRKK